MKEIRLGHLHDREFDFAGIHPSTQSSRDLFFSAQCDHLIGGEHQNPHSAKYHVLEKRVEQFKFPQSKQNETN